MLLAIGSERLAVIIVAATTLVVLMERGRRQLGPLLAAPERPVLGSDLSASKVAVVSRAAASDSADQCDTRSARAPA